jgi:superoxide dismutase, Cu-Zn family
MRKVVYFLTIVLLAVSAGSALAQNQPPPQAKGEFKTSVGETVGNATMTQNADGSVRLQVQVRGLPPGAHGIHFHAVGACAPDFEAAGGHYNPASREHGLENPNGPHAGDLPNLTINADGTGALDTNTTLVTLAPGDQTLFDADGTALVIHAFTDDQKTSPSGNSGARIACAVVQPAAVAPAGDQPAAQPGGQPAQLPTTGAADYSWLALLLAALLLLTTGLMTRRGQRAKE